MSNDRAHLTPLRLESSLHPTIWGGTKLAVVAGKILPTATKIGESWETETSNHILNGPFEGRTLGQVVAELDSRLLGTRAIEVFGHRFPLLAKFIDAQDKLSVQVHPNDEQARDISPDMLGKTEAWYVLQANPDARLVVGFAHPVSHADVRLAIHQNRLEALLHSFVVKSGDVVFVPAGTVHAIGGGVVLYELQEYSDITYRLYDYGRKQADGSHRELHVEQGMKVLSTEPTRHDRSRVLQLDTPTKAVDRRILAACGYFVLEELAVSSTVSLATLPTSCEILTVLEGACDIQCLSDPALSVGQGESVVLPAQLGNWTLSASQVRLLRSYVPKADDVALMSWQKSQLD